jgi:hypothetical protein
MKTNGSPRCIRRTIPTGGADFELVLDAPASCSRHSLVCFEMDLEVNAVDPEVDVVGARRIAAAERGGFVWLVAPSQARER